jgi:hypothetical protein
MNDFAVVAVLALSFATLLTVHVVICVRLVFVADRRWRGLVAFVVAPCAPWWAHDQSWRMLVRVWVVALVVYALARVAAAF